MTESTLYPNISGKSHNLVRELSKVGLCRGKIELVGTVKLHGSHADIVVDSDDNIRLQSRNVLSVTAENDSYGYAAFMLPLRNEILELKSQYLARYTKLNPGSTIDSQHPLIIAGEWIGQGIQKRVAVNQLSRRFVIVSVSINNTWLLDEDYADIRNEAAGIYNISRGGFYYQTLVLAPLHIKFKPQQEACFAAMQDQTEKIDQLCPFSATFGISGVGEGIVWKVQQPPYHAKPELWLKTKGRTHMEPPQQNSNPEKNAAMTGARSKAATFARGVVTARRLEQGFEYLMEMLLLPDRKNTGTYIQWVQNDVLREEKTEIEAAGINQGTLKAEIIKIAKEHYQKSLTNEEK